MKYVIDSSVAFKWVLKEIDSDKADRLREDYQNAIHELISPDVFQIELAHALTRAERQKRIAVGDAEILWNEVMTTPPVFYSPLVARGIQISSTNRIGVYDCLYIALAEQEACQLITADVRLAAQKQFPFILSLSDLP
jgi:predicted nucleic acid-binding protein